MCLNDIYSQLFITCNADVAFSRFSASDVLITKQSKQLCVLYKSLLFLIMHIHLNLSHSLVMFQSFIDYTYFVFTFMFSLSLSLSTHLIIHLSVCFYFQTYLVSNTYFTLLVNVQQFAKPFQKKFVFKTKPVEIWTSDVFILSDMCCVWFLVILKPIHILIVRTCVDRTRRCFFLT